MRAIARLANFEVPGLADPSRQPQVEWDLDKLSIAVSTTEPDTIIVKNEATLRAVNFTFSEHPRQVIVTTLRATGTTGLEIGTPSRQC